MEPFFFLPIWFFPIGMLLELFFIAGSFIFSYYTWKIYSLSNVKRMKLLSYAFFFFGFSYFIQLTTHISLLNAATGNQKIMLLTYSLYGFICFQLLGLNTLLYLTLKRKDKIFYFMLLTLGILIISTGRLELFAIYAITILLTTAVIHRTKKGYSGFILLLTGDKIGFILASPTGSLISHIILAGAYLTIVFLLILIHYGKKK